MKILCGIWSQGRGSGIGNGDEVSIFSQVSSADFHFHRMQLNASFVPLLLFFLCLLSVAATKVSQTMLKCIYKCKNERGAAAQRGHCSTSRSRESVKNAFLLTAAEEWKGKYARTLSKLSPSFHFSVNCKRLTKLEQLVSSSKEGVKDCKYHNKY